jgi:hypothetical protein
MRVEGVRGRREKHLGALWGLSRLPCIAFKLNLNLCLTKAHSNESHRYPLKKNESKFHRCPRHPQQPPHQILRSLPILNRQPEAKPSGKTPTRRRCPNLNFRVIFGVMNQAD